MGKKTHSLFTTIILRTDTLEALEEFLDNGKGWDSAIMKLIEHQEAIDNLKFEMEPRDNKTIRY